MGAGFQKPEIGPHWKQGVKLEGLGSCLVGTLAMPKKKMWFHKKLEEHEERDLLSLLTTLNSLTLKSRLAWNSLHRAVPLSQSSMLEL